MRTPPIATATRTCFDRRLARTATAVALLSVVVGCGGSGIALVPVTGKVTFAGSPPPAKGNVTFTPVKIEKGLPNRPGSANFAEDGTFTVTSFKPGDGLIPGTYHPNVSCWQGVPVSTDPSSFDRLNYVPRDFVAPPVVVDANAGQVEVVIDVPRKK